MVRPCVGSRTSGVAAGDEAAVLARALLVVVLAAATIAETAAAPPPQLAKLWGAEHAEYSSSDDLSVAGQDAASAADDPLEALADYSALGALSAAKADSSLHAKDDRAQRVRLALDILERVAAWYGSRAPAEGDNGPRVGESNDDESYIGDGSDGDSTSYSDDQYEDGRAKKNFAKLTNTRLAYRPIGADY